MNRILYLIFSVLAAITLTACPVIDEPDPQPNKPVNTVARRTILVYMAAKNNLSGFGSADINEMLLAEIPADCRLLVFRSAYDRPAELLEVVDGNLETLKTYPEETIGADAETLSEVLADSRSFVSSREWGVIFWSHSTGWKGAVRAPASRAFGQEYSRQIELPDFARAIETAPRFDFIMFDSCYMGGVEVAYQLRHAADYLVASVCEVPSDGMPYNRTLPSLFSEDIPSGLIEAVDINVDYYLSRPSELCPSTMSVIDLSKMEALAAASKPIYAAPVEAEEPFQKFSVTTPYKSLFVDFANFMEQTAPSEEALATFSAALDEAVIHERHTSRIWGQLEIEHCSGLSVNPEPENPDYSYRNLLWYTDVISPYGIED